jgi:hypothetical protein
MKAREARSKVPRLATLRARDWRVPPIPTVFRPCGFPMLHWRGGGWVAIPPDDHPAPARRFPTRGEAAAWAGRLMDAVT